MDTTNSEVIALLQNIEARLANLEGLQTNFFNVAHDIYWITFGAMAGIVGAYVLMREALKKW